MNDKHPDKKKFIKNLKELGVTWEAAPGIEEIKKIQERIIIGPNGCGKSRLLRALDETLQANDVNTTGILFADFPEMANLERRRTDGDLTLLKKIFQDKAHKSIHSILKLISSDPIIGINELVKISSDEECMKAISKVNDFSKSLLGVYGA